MGEDSETGGSNTGGSDSGANPPGSRIGAGHVTRVRQGGTDAGIRAGLWIVGLCIILGAAVMPARADQGTGAVFLRPAILFHTDVEIGTPGTGYFQMAAAGARAFAQASGTPVPHIFPDDARDLDPPADDGAFATTRFALAQGYNTLVGVGFNYAKPFAMLAPLHPDVRFILIDAVSDAPNVAPILFREEEGSYLVGLLAALFSDSGRIGFVGGWDAPIIRAFGCGFIQGALSVRPETVIDVAMVGDTPGAFYEPEAGYRLASAMYRAGADVVFHAAGQSGEGVIRAAAEHDAYAIGVDTNQNGDAPGHVLTSMLKRVDIAVFSTLKRLSTGLWSPELTVLGLKEGGVDWVLDRHNSQLITPMMHEAAEDAEFEIRTGAITVAGYTEDAGCPVYDFDAPGPAPQQGGPP